MLAVENNWVNRFGNLIVASLLLISKFRLGRRESRTQTLSSRAGVGIRLECLAPQVAIGLIHSGRSEIKAIVRVTIP